MTERQRFERQLGIRRRRRTVIAVVPLLAVLIVTLLQGGVRPVSATVVTPTGAPVAIAAPTGTNGYTLLDSNGNIYNFGTDYLGGSPAGATLPFVGIAYTPSGRGYALLDSAGHVYNYGDSQYRGGAPAGAALPFVAIAYKPGTLGYTLVDSVGHIYNYGTDYRGGNPVGATTPFRVLAYTPTGAGYTLMDSVGHIYNYGDSQYRGGAPVGASAMRGLAYRPGTDAYTELDAAGHIYNYGTGYLGGAPAGSSGQFVGLVYTPSGNGYALSDGVGHIYNYGDSIYRGGFGATASSVNGSISRSEVLQRAQTWVAAKVPYNQSKSYTNVLGTYRTDCSGFVSMAWHLGSSLTTATLPRVSTKIPATELQPGDVLLRRDSAQHHVVLFVGWSPTDAGRHRYFDLQEESKPGVGTVDLANQDLQGSAWKKFTPYRYTHTT